MAVRHQLVAGIMRIEKSPKWAVRLQHVLTLNTANHMRPEEATA